MAALFVVDSNYATASSGTVTPGFYEMGASSEEGQRYEQARILALQLLGSANGLEDSMAALASNAAEHLTATKFYVSADAEGDLQCAQMRASLFVTDAFPNAIFICADTRWHVQQSSDSVVSILAQAFIHEAVHLSGTADECQATLLELKATEGGLGTVGYGNFRRYSKQCNGSLDGYAPKRR